MTVELQREVPEALKHRRIEIATGQGSVAHNRVTTLKPIKAA